MLGGIAIGIPIIATGKNPFFPIAIFIIGGGLCVAGYGTRKNKRWGGITAIIFSFLSLISPPVIGFIFGVSIIIITISNWKKLS